MPGNDEARPMSALKYPERDYTAYDPFEGDRDVDVRCRSVKLVRGRVEHPCWNGYNRDTSDGPHTIKAGELHRYERALIDREYWGSYRICIACMDRWFDEWVYPPEDARRALATPPAAKEA